MSLFEPSPICVVDDAEGGIRYWPGFVDSSTADRWFAGLHSGAAWQVQRRPMYDRVVDVPRLLAAYLIGSLPDNLPLAEILARVDRTVPAPYNAIGLNLYRDGRDSVAMHNDKLPTIAPGRPISLLSLGHPRRMLIRPKSGDRTSVAIDLAPGSLLAMSHAAQLTHEHGIPKTARAIGPRISVVLRVRPGR